MKESKHPRTKLCIMSVWTSTKKRWFARAGASKEALNKDGSAFFTIRLSGVLSRTQLSGGFNQRFPKALINTVASAIGIKMQFDVTVVAQLCKLLYRRFATGRRKPVPCAGINGRPAECNSAIRQVANLRYDQSVLAAKADAIRNEKTCVGANG